VAEVISLLSWTFVKEFSNSTGKAIDEIADDSMAALLSCNRARDDAAVRRCTSSSVSLCCDHKPRTLRAHSWS